MNLQHMPDYFGHGETMSSRRVLWIDGSPVPWMTYPAICYLKQIDFSGRKVFEYGCGSSTMFWARKAASVVSVEHEQAWFDNVTGQRPLNVEVFLRSGKEYVDTVAYGAPHDVIVIDGRWRFDCALKAGDYLSPNGMVILDNSERFPKITEHFRQLGLLQVDLIGHGPLNSYIWATSVFLSRTSEFKPLGAIQPSMQPGMIDSIEVKEEYWEGNKPGAFM